LGGNINMMEFTHPIPVITPLGDGYAMYVTNGGTFENDVWCVCMCQGGHVRHFTSDQIRIHKNGTFDVTES